MTRFVLASWLATQVWAWDAVPTATHYRIYWGTSPSAWCELQYVELAASSVCSGPSCEWNLPEPPGNKIFVNITAINARGESSWDHGAKVVCP